jgi:hypothetical protein
MERAVDFHRDRRMRCGQCDQAWAVDLAWIERWHAGDEACPGCGTSCEAENGARITVSEDDPALDDGKAKDIAWYHSSTYAEWPPTIDFASSLDDHARLMMGGDEAVGRWANRQSTKALHVGTYESAIHNMLRRITDQGDSGKQFYLYRVHLKSTTVIDPGWTTDPSNFVGDVHLDDLCSPEVEAVRYVNYHEDPGGLSFAIRPSAIGTTQRLAIPLAPRPDEPWIVDTAERLSDDPPDPWLPVELRSFAYVFDSSARAETAAAAVIALVDRLPTNLRYQLDVATRWHTGCDPTEWARHTFGLAELIDDSARVLAELDAQPTRPR